MPGDDGATAPEPERDRTATLVAVWPGMGQVALTAGYYLMSRLKMIEVEPLAAQDLFDREHVDVKDGLLQKAPLPQGRLFRWENPGGPRDLVVYIGEAQPPSGKNAFCDRLLDAAAKLGVRDVFTFAAMATDMPSTHASRVFGVATDETGLRSLRARNVNLLDSGRIAGLNGVFLAAAAEHGMRGVGLLGEIPALVSHVPFPKASRSVLTTFSSLSGVEIDLRELELYEQTMERQVADLLSRIEKSLPGNARDPVEPAEAAEPEFPSEPEPRVTEADRTRIEGLFLQAGQDNSKSFELKRELDRLGVFRDYEDRFLDLFRKAG